MPADTPAQEAPMTDPIKLAREALSTLIGVLEIAAVMPETIKKVLVLRLDAPELDQARTALAALDAIPQPAQVPGDAELNALQEMLAIPPLNTSRQAMNIMAEADTALTALRTRLAEVEGELRSLRSVVLGYQSMPGYELHPMTKAQIEGLDERAAHRKLKGGK